MSQMGKVIKEVLSLFRQRDEQLLAEAKDPKLFAAVKEFKAAIDDFEVRNKERQNGLKANAQNVRNISSGVQLDVRSNQDSSVKLGAGEED